MFGFHINVDEFWLTFWFMQIEYHLMLETSYSNQYKYYIFIFINAIHSTYLNYSKCHFLDEVWIVKEKLTTPPTTLQLKLLRFTIFYYAFYHVDEYSFQ